MGFLCEFAPQQECRFPRKCQSLGCALVKNALSLGKFRAEKLPWQTDYTKIEDDPRRN